MKLLYAIAVLLTFAVCCQGYSFLIPAKIGQPGVCWYNGILLQHGDNSMPSSCQNMHCNDDGSVLVQGCGHFEMRDCRVIDPINIHKPYPDCCKMNFLCAMVNGQPITREVSPLDRRVYA